MSPIKIGLLLGGSICLALAIASNEAKADEHHGYHGYHGYHGPVYVEHHNSTGDVLMPMVVGGVVGYMISNANQPKQVVVQQPQVIQQPAPLYRKDTIYDANCSCYKEVFVQVQ